MNGSDPRLTCTELTATIHEAGFSFEDIRLTYVRVKPEGGLIAGFCGCLGSAGADVPDQWGYVVFLNDRASSTFEKARAMHPVEMGGKAGVGLAASRGAVVFLFPNDRQLRDLRWVVRLDKLKRTLRPIRDDGTWRIRARKSSMTVVRYKPEKRLLASLSLVWRNDATGDQDSQDAFLRFFPDDRGARLHALNAALSRGGLDVPESLGSFMGGRLYVEARVPGRTLQELLVSGASVPAEPVVDLVARLHGLDSDLPRLPDPATDLCSALSALETVARHSDRAGDILLRIRREVAGLKWPEPETGVVHADLHSMQIMMHGDRVTLLDLERTGLGDPRRDLGLWRAQLALLASTYSDARDGILRFDHAFRAAYAAKCHDHSDASLAPFELLGWLELAQLPFRRQEADWEEQTLARLTKAEGLASSTQVCGGVVGSPLQRIVRMVPHARSPWSSSWLDERGRLVHGVFDPDSNVLREVPERDDPVLASLRAAFPGGELVVRRAHRRCVMRVGQDDAVRYVRGVRKRKLGRTLDRWTRASAAADAMGGPSLRVSRVLEFSTSGGWMTTECLKGETLHQRLKGAAYGGEAWDALLVIAKDMGLRLAHWHSAPMDLECLDSPKDDAWLEEFLELSRMGWSRMNLDLHTRLDRLSPAPEGDTRFIHGDLHDKNIGSDGRSSWLLDLDSLRQGCPEEDLGNLMAHLDLRGLQWSWCDAGDAEVQRAILEGYREAKGNLQENLLHAHRHRTLLRLASLYSLRAEAMTLVPGIGRLLDEMERQAP